MRLPISKHGRYEGFYYDAKIRHGILAVSTVFVYMARLLKNISWRWPLCSALAIYFSLNQTPMKLSHRNTATHFTLETLSTRACFCVMVLSAWTHVGTPRA